jgi:hypothetical protein
MSEQAPYTYVNPDAFASKHEEAMADRESMGFEAWSPKQGAVGQPIRSAVRILPPHVNMQGNWFVRMRTHFSLGPNQNVAAPCLEPYGQPCPACQWVDTLYQRGRAETDPGRRQQYNALAYNQKSSVRFMVNVIDMAEPLRGVQRWAMGQTLYERVRTAFFDDAKNWRDITHPQNGRDVILEVSTKPKTKYRQYDVVRAAEQPTPLVNMQLLFQIADLSEFVYQPTLDEAVGALQGKKIERNKRTALPGGVGGQPALPPAPIPSAPVLPVQPVRQPVVVPTAPPVLVAPPPVPSAPVPGAWAPPPAPVPPAAPAPVPGAWAPPPVPVPPAAPPAALAPPAASAVAPPPAPPATGRRGRRRASSEAPPAAVAPAQQPLPGVISAPVPPVVAPPASAAANGSYGYARAELARMQQASMVPPFTPFELTPAQLDAEVKPPCFLRETDPADEACRKCSMLLPCLEARIVGSPGSVAWTYPGK